MQGKAAYIESLDVVGVPQDKKEVFLFCLEVLNSYQELGFWSIGVLPLFKDEDLRIICLLIKYEKYLYQICITEEEVLMLGNYELRMLLYQQLEHFCMELKKIRG